MNTLNSPIDRSYGAVLGQAVGDALSMPVHWIYDRFALRMQYGEVRDYLAPITPHPTSILYRSHYEALNEKGDILGEQAQYWGKEGVHYHQFLQAGENTLNLKVNRLLIQSLNEKSGLDPDDFLQRYIDFMLAPAGHNDIYVEEYHRHFFTNYAKGVEPRQCAALNEKHIGGLIHIIPVATWYADDPREALAKAMDVLALTHRGPKMEMATKAVVPLLLKLLHGAGLRDALEEAINAQHSPLFGHPFRKWLDMDDAAVVEGKLSTACYVEFSVPAVLYLALKYHDDPEAGLIANTNLGGDNAGRGALLGALYGAAYGAEGFPERWRSGLKEPPPALDPTGDRS